jgi:hypothetical protein
MVQALGTGIFADMKDSGWWTLGYKLVREAQLAAKIPHVNVDSLHPDVDIASDTTSVLPDLQSKLRRQLGKAGEHRLCGTRLGLGFDKILNDHIRFEHSGIDGFGSCLNDLISFGHFARSLGLRLALCGLLLGRHLEGDAGATASTRGRKFDSLCLNKHRVDGIMELMHSPS